MKALNEAITIGQKAGIPVHISHLQIVEPYGEATPEKIIALIKKARAAGLNLTADSYPYDIGNTWLVMISAPKYRTSVCIRPEYRTGAGRQELLRVTEADLKKINCDQLIINSYVSNRSFEGKSLAAIAKNQGKSLAEMYVELASDNNAPMVLYPCQNMKFDGAKSYRHIHRRQISAG
jgi:N-acyl-D-aspartate/D-glutamate deacylase